MNLINIKFCLIFILVVSLICFLSIQKGFSQGFNNNEWIFGYCGANEENNYLSFGKDGEAKVASIPGNIPLERGNVAIAIDPISGEILFYTNGELAFNFYNNPLQGVAGAGLGGDADGRQTVGISSFDYQPEEGGNKLFYIFYLTPGGQLNYSVIDMNDQGGAPANGPPGGAVTGGGTIGPASGAVVVVSSPQSPSFLISFDNGNLISRRIENTEGDFTETDQANITGTPKAIIFDEENQKLLIIPEGPNQDIIVVDYNSANGTFGAVSSISQSGGSDPIEGVSYSPDGDFIYFSRGDQLFRIPADDLDAAPVAMPTDNPSRIFDIKVGPDGSLYYIYEETLGGPQLIGRVTNPDEELLEDLEIEEDPFDGADFCGTIFPSFAPNQDLDPTVDFTWTPANPCTNNPLQLISEITPANYTPESYEWSFTPPLVDEDGQEVDMDFNQQHLLIPAEATTQQSISVTLTVKFADGQELSIPKVINFQENQLQAQFTAQDTTVCDGPGCLIDIGALLEVSQQGGQGGQPGQPGQPGIPGQPGQPGQGQQGNYEYFWSNLPDKGWTTDTENCVSLPGAYWVLVREPGAECYVYASMRVKIWDLEDRANNIWYFGDGAGLDFNPDPNNPDGPVPRPVGHNQNIPAGTTTISDEAGQVLFFTDGSTVWDLSGNVMPNGDNIGGDNNASQSVIGVPVPRDETLFYLFTTQSTGAGSNQVKFSLVDIKGSTQNPGVGNVLTKDNLLFSPSTEHSAAVESGDTTWVVFHELGNNTFRAYPVSEAGLGLPVFSSVGSNHTFSSGSGAMKFSSDGNRLAVTINDGNCNRVEIFDFDQGTGRLTEYALLDLGCDGDLYGLEFSDDGNRIFVSYRGGGSRVEEIFIGGNERTDTSDPDNPVTTTCPTCFENAEDQSAIEQCILQNRNVVPNTQGLNLGAVQIGPDGQIYVAVVGSNQIGQILVGAECNTSTFNQDGVETMPGTSNLGLPSFVQNSGSSIPDPSLSGPDQICLDPVEGAFGQFEGGGEPDIDSYFWTILDDSGVEVFSTGGPGENFQTLEYIFEEDGFFTVNLEVDRCGTPWEETFSLRVEVIAAPIIDLPDNVVFCADEPYTLTAVDPDDPYFDEYIFEWRNAAGELLGEENDLEITEESIYTVVVSFAPPEGVDPDAFFGCSSTASVFAGPAFDFELTQTADRACFEEFFVTFAPDTPITGQWFVQKEGDAQRTSLGEFFELEIDVRDLDGPGFYEFTFIGEDPILPGCQVEKSVDFEVLPLANFTLETVTDATDCNTPDGSFQITMLTDAQNVLVLETDFEIDGNIAQGEVILVENLLPGIYTVRATRDGCSFTQTVAIANLNPPDDFLFEVYATPETCDDLGVSDGSIVIDFLGVPQSGSFTITREENGVQTGGPFTDQVLVTIPVRDGTYAIEISDSTDPNVEGCIVPFLDKLEVGNVSVVNFSVREEVTACEAFVFRPQTNEDLVFTITSPNGQVIQEDAEGNFTLTQSGTYTVLGEDVNDINCPDTQEFNLTVVEPVPFTLSEPIVDCDSGIRFEAILPSNNPNEVVFLWKNENGNIVGTEQSFIPPNEGGSFSLEVQLNTASDCSLAPIVFEAPSFVANVPVELNALPFCIDDVFTTISIEADLIDVGRIEWYVIENGQPILLTQYTDFEEITVTENGLYEVVLINNYDCPVGSDRAQVTKSFTEAPILAESYTICAIENVVEVLNPGNFDEYEWILDDEVVSTDAVFTPTLPGTYELIVRDVLGCEFVLEFVIIEDCELKITFPNAMEINNPNKNFIVFANEYINEIEVFIFNRWGELIFFCEHQNIEPGTSFCPWDGTVVGKAVPIGTYPVVVRFKSNNQNIERTLRKSILVLE
ncbi:T9SS type B sorting domain-containing protein [Pararhodonellum marinum]|uniref:T9SS type B sorting domain-containing protein n=1 Tax=Pararhodonellum marinum TaxID=2755358 RepID=UPI00293C057F|nr:gliding motility-associated C-terminal domain-containing protein [Pararhodonellum marinum]